MSEVDDLGPLFAVLEAARAISGFGWGDGFGGYSPHECVFCECSLWEPVRHDNDCEFQRLTAALNQVDGDV